MCNVYTRAFDCKFFIQNMFTIAMDITKFIVPVYKWIFYWKQ